MTPKFSFYLFAMYSSRNSSNSFLHPSASANLLTLSTRSPGRKRSPGRDPNVPTRSRFNRTRLTLKTRFSLMTVARCNFDKETSNKLFVHSRLYFFTTLQVYDQQIPNSVISRDTIRVSPALALRLPPPRTDRPPAKSPRTAGGLRRQHLPCEGRI